MRVVPTTHRARSHKTILDNSQLGVALNGAHPDVYPFDLERKEVSLMENLQEELKAHLMATNEEFRSLADQHSRFHKELEALTAKPYLSPAEEAEEHRLKKQKLRLKDQMNSIMARYRAQQVA